MIKLTILKGEKDEADQVFMREEGGDPAPLTFDIIKAYSMRLLDLSARGEDSTYEISSDDSLIMYKETIERTFSSIVNDSDLKALYLDIASKKKPSE